MTEPIPLIGGKDDLKMDLKDISPAWKGKQNSWYWSLPLTRKNWPLSESSNSSILQLSKITFSPRAAAISVGFDVTSKIDSCMLFLRILFLVKEKQGTFTAALLLDT
ncbi:hypothetical protein [Neobacillus notoginsengisoli]|uniref:hypothetical protein n=1 Tax=Neobacillus notoginsengisoli TaxID=1578198 RepID=UPI001314ABD5|nr:hypothetical protein [Neobacillus notoginsengisoli]